MPIACFASSVASYQSHAASGSAAVYHLLVRGSHVSGWFHTKKNKEGALELPPPPRKYVSPHPPAVPANIAMTSINNGSSAGGIFSPLLPNEQVDYVIVARLPPIIAELEQLEREQSNQLNENDSDHMRHAKWRYRFFQEAQEVGLKVEKWERPCDESRHAHYVYYKVHAPFDVLADRAEHLAIKMPLKGKAPQFEHSNALMKYLAAKFPRITNFFWHGIPVEESSYSSTFHINSLEQFEGSEDPNTFFRPALRSYLVYSLLNVLEFADSDQAININMGVVRMEVSGGVDSHFPLHENPYEDDDPYNTGQLRLLLDKWASWKAWHYVQPLDVLRTYFGEKLSFYYAFLGHYTLWLSAAGFMGFVVFFAGFSFRDQHILDEVCNSNLTICASCSSCDTVRLDSLCSSYSVSYLFDNPLTVYFAVFMNIWGTFFLEFWKRRAYALSYDWDTMSGARVFLEPLRPLFRPDCTRINPVTKKEEPHFRPKKKYIRMFTGLSVCLLLTVVLVILVLGIIAYRVAVREAIFLHGGSYQERAGPVASVTAAVLNLVFIVVLAMVYKLLALKLTDWENHRFQEDYERQLALKMFVFQFVNNYASLFYIAFFKGRFAGYPGNYNTFWGMRTEQCAEYGCLLEVTITLAITMVGKQLINQTQEIIIPYISMWWNKRQRNNLRSAKVSPETLIENGSAGPSQSDGDKKKLSHAVSESAEEYREQRLGLEPWEFDRTLQSFPDVGLFYEYLEMVLQFGFVLLFVAAFPLAPLFAFLNNILEIRVDAMKSVKGRRRTVAFPAANIGLWLHTLELINLLAAITNGAVIGFTSDFIPQLVYREKMGTMTGYVSSLYARSPVSASDPGASPGDLDCYYRDYRDDTGSRTTMWYEVLMARLAFVLIFENFIFFFKMFFAHLVPDIPKKVKTEIQREQYKGEIALAEAQANKKRRKTAAYVTA
eukprot:m.159840 g.159840  ORF g.159840 m.159840 type:complete len:944 (+) comp20920_c0_seq5:129-2960(+)